MNRVFPFQVPQGVDCQIIHFHIPQNPDDLDPALEHLCTVFHDSCLDHSLPLAQLMYGLVAPDGALPQLCEVLAQKFNRHPSRVAIAVLATMGNKFVKIEMLKAREDLKTEGRPEQTIDVDWFKANRDKYSFTYVCATMDEEIRCDCPGCVMFWAGKQSVLCFSKQKMREAIDRLGAFIAEDHERFGPGCVKHLMQDGPHGVWYKIDDEEE